MPEIGVDDPAENRRRLRIRIMRIFLCTLGPNHPKCQAFIKAEDKAS
jgi:hypothetical protein